MTDRTGKKETVFYLALGSNQGDCENHLRQALKKLNAAPNVQLAKISSVYETAPVGKTDQPAFLNMAVKGYTSLTAAELLEVTQRIENRGGRMRKESWGPRTIDLDILLFGTERIKTETLTIPHPHMEERAFVLIPLAEIEPELTLANGTRVCEQIDRCEDKDGVIKKRTPIRGEEIRGN